MPSKRILYEAYWRDVLHRSEKADREAMYFRRAARRSIEEKFTEEAERWERRAVRLDSLGMKIVGRLL